MIEIQGLEKSYGSNKALNGVSFRIERGEIVGLLGLNGAGKSTTMNIMTGCLAPSDGTVLINGIDIVKEPLAAKRSIGYLPEIPPLYVDMKVEQYLDFVYDLKRVSLPRHAHLDEVCSRAGVQDVRGRLIRNLSKGYRQRVGLAQALIGDPPILVLDEPTVGLDPTQIIEMRGLIAEMGKERTVILSSHILSEIQAVCGRVLVIDKGVLVADESTRALQSGGYDFLVATVEGAPEAVCAALQSAAGVTGVQLLAPPENGAADYTVRGEAESDIRRAVFEALAKAGLPMLGLRTAQPTLEEIFLRLVGAGQKPGGEA